MVDPGLLEELLDIAALLAQGGGDREQAAGHMWSRARSDRRGSRRQTSGTAGCSGAARASSARSVSRRTPAATRPAGVARAAPRVGFLRRLGQRSGTGRKSKPITFRKLASPGVV